jgi:hypothetical protein
VFHYDKNPAKTPISGVCIVGRRSFPTTLDIVCLQAVHWIDDDPTRFLDHMPHLVHDFQCGQVGPEHSVSLVLGRDVQTFQEGEDRNLDTLPKAIQHKVFNKSHPVRLTEEELVIYRGFENMVPFIAGGRLPWPEPPKDCDLFHCVEKELLVPPSATVNPRGDRAFGTTVKLQMLSPPEPGQVTSAGTNMESDETGSPHTAILPSWRPCDAIVSMEKRDATSPIPRNDKAQKRDVIHGPAAAFDRDADDDRRPYLPRRLRPNFDNEKGDEPPNADLASPSVASRDPGTVRSTQFTSLDSTLRSPRDRTPSQRAYDEMTLDELAREMKLHNIDITKAVLVELVRRRWDAAMDPYIEKTARIMIRNGRCSLDATKVNAAWDMDRALNDLWAGERDINSKNNRERTICMAVTYLAELSTRPWFDEVFNHCGRRETLKSGIASASEYLRHANAPPIAERELLRLTSL